MKKRLKIIALTAASAGLVAIAEQAPSEGLNEMFSFAKGESAAVKVKSPTPEQKAAVMAKVDGDGDLKGGSIKGMGYLKPPKMSALEQATPDQILAKAAKRFGTDGSLKNEKASDDIRCGEYNKLPGEGFKNGRIKRDVIPADFTKTKGK